MFRKLDLLPSSGKKGRAETLAVGPPGCYSLRPGPKNHFYRFYAPALETFRLHLEIWGLENERTLTKTSGGFVSKY
jgi:hypothetical protein